MKNITPHNCEAWMLDYFEGRLNEKQSAELIDFLELHPEWKAEFDAFGDIEESLKIASENNTNTTELRSSLLQNSRDEDLIALLEGQLNAIDSSRLLQELEHDEKLAGDFAIYQLTKVKPDFTIEYPNKSKLRKSAPVRVLMLRYAAVAALLFGALMGGWLYFNPLTTNTERNVASTVNIPAATDHMVTSSENGSNPTGIDNTPKSAKAATVPLLAENETITTRPAEANDSSKTPEPNPHNADHIAKVPDDPRPETQIDAMHTRQRTNILVATAVIPAQLIDAKSNPPAPNPNWLTDEPATGLGGMLANFGQNVVERLKNATGNNIVIEQEESPEDELYTSTFRLGSLEIYRSRIKKE